MKTLTPEEAARAVLDGKTVLAESYNQNYLITTTPENLFAAKFEDSNGGFNEAWNFGFDKDYTYTLCEESKQEEKKYRWLVEKSDCGAYNFVSPEYYLTFKEVKDLFRAKSNRFKRLECLDDLKDKPYYTEEF